MIRCLLTERAKVPGDDFAVGGGPVVRAAAQVAVTGALVGAGCLGHATDQLELEPARHGGTVAPGPSLDEWKKTPT